MRVCREALYSVLGWRTRSCGGIASKEIRRDSMIVVGVICFIAGVLTGLLWEFFRWKRLLNNVKHDAARLHDITK